ncbi:MAG TPA: cytochrome c-type biogenesis protein CcmH [Terriglobales bacterium]|jgi:cytochrome c-type biogenesis protein CcmH
MRSVPLAAVLLVFAALAVGAGDQGIRFDRMGHNLMCTCSCNQVLLECNHVGCQNSDGMRKKLASLVESGASDKAIYDDFVNDWGTTVIAAPVGGGFNRVAWIMPFAVLFAGVVGVGFVARQWKLRPAKTTRTPQVVSDRKLEEFRQQARKDTEE